MLERFDLHNANPFSQKMTSDHEYVLSLSEQIWEKLQIDKTKKVPLKKECLVATLINLRNGWLTGKYIRYSRKPIYYTEIPYRYKRDFFTYKIMCGILTSLHENGYTIEHKGFKNPQDKYAQQTKVRASEALETGLKRITNDMLVDLEPTEYIVLRGRGKKGLRLQYKETPSIVKQRNDLREYNALRQSTAITIAGTVPQSEKNDLFLSMYATNKTKTEINLRNPYIYRVYNEDFTKGGRYYNGIESNMPKALRGQLYINGEKTVELDYSGMHIRLLYNLESLNPRGNFYDDLSEGDPELRKLYKLIALVSINASTIQKAYMALRHTLMKSDLKSLLPDLTNKSIKFYYDKWINAHPKIAGYFNSDIGITLQNYDSKISSRIIKHFTKKSVPVLVVHDSFILNEEFKDELEEVMKREYITDFGFDPIIN